MLYFFFSRKLCTAHCSSFAANKARKAQEKAARAEVEQGAAAAQAKATAVRRNVAQKAPVSEAPMSELQKKLLARQAQ
jgi:predicted 2-oxoglutarate/Fe(II)-dependent dioxygenase YbiX